MMAKRGRAITGWQGCPRVAFVPYTAPRRPRPRVCGDVGARVHLQEGWGPASACDQEKVQLGAPAPAAPPRPTSPPRCMTTVAGVRLPTCRTPSGPALLLCPACSLWRGSGEGTAPKGAETSQPRCGQPGGRQRGVPEEPEQGPGAGWRAHAARRVASAAPWAEEEGGRGSGHAVRRVSPERTQSDDVSVSSEPLPRTVWWAARSSRWRPRTALDLRGAGGRGAPAHAHQEEPRQRRLQGGAGPRGAHPRSSPASQPWGCCQPRRLPQGPQSARGSRTTMRLRASACLCPCGPGPGPALGFPSSQLPSRARRLTARTW